MALLRVGYRVAYRLLRAYTSVRRPQVRGAMVVVRDGDGKVLLVRHTYGDRARWELPGGWLHRDEDPAAGARREAAEELGIDVSMRPIGTLDGDWDFKRSRVSVFAADWPGGHGSYDPVEIAEVRWFDPDAPPPGTGAATRRVLGGLL